jgi:HEAT repeat protein
MTVTIGRTIACVALALVAAAPATAARPEAWQDDRDRSERTAPSYVARLEAEQASERAARDREIAREREQAERERQQAARERERGAQERAEGQYERAMRYVDRAEWSRALEQFRALSTVNFPRADAAFYWQAYSLDKLNRQAEALTTVAEMLKNYPMSRWLNEARALELAMRQRAGQPVSPDQQNDDDLKLLAIQGLQQMDPAQGVPLLEKILQGTQSPRLKERALFVLAQSNSSRAQQVLADVAKGNSNPDLQRKAIQYLGVHGSAANRQILADIYGSSSDVDIKRQILRSFGIAGDRQRVLAAATSEKSPELRSEAVRSLGMMGARDELWQLYQKESSVDVKQQMLGAMMMSGDVAHLTEVANSEANMDLRRRAIQQLGMAGGGRSGDTLVNIYNRQSDAGVKRAVIEGLFVSGNATALVTLARKESDRDLKRRIVEKLALMDSREAQEYMLELLK